MAALVYDLNLAEFDHRPFERSATYACSGEYGRLTVTLTEDELVAEFGLVPSVLHVIVKDLADIPADAWLDAPSQGQEV